MRPIPIRPSAVMPAADRLAAFLLAACLLAACLLVSGLSPARAEPLRNASQFGIGMRAGPGPEYPMIHVLDPGEVADRGRCNLDGRWCLLTARDKIGWVDIFGLAQPRPGEVRVEEVRPLRDAPIETTPLDSPARPLPGLIVDAVNGALDGRLPPGVGPVPVPLEPTYVPPVHVPGARAPRLLSTSETIRNITGGEVNLRAGPGTEHAIVGRLRPGEGGPLDVCDPFERWCRVDVPDIGRAWVRMTLMGLRRL